MARREEWLPYALVSLDSPLHAVRQVGVDQLRWALAQDSTYPADFRVRAASELLHRVGQEDAGTGGALAAEDLLKACRSFPGLLDADAGLLDQLRAQLGGGVHGSWGAAECVLRCVAVAFAAMAADQALVRGLLPSVHAAVKALAKDPLAACAVLELCREAAAAPGVPPATNEAILRGLKDTLHVLCHAKEQSVRDAALVVCFGNKKRGEGGVLVEREGLMGGGRACASAGASGGGWCKFEFSTDAGFAAGGGRAFTCRPRLIHAGIATPGGVLQAWASMLAHSCSSSPAKVPEGPVADIMYIVALKMKDAEAVAAAVHAGAASGGGGAHLGGCCSGVVPWQRCSTASP